MSVSMSTVVRFLWVFWLIASAGLIWALSVQGLTAAHLLLALGLLLVGYWLSPVYGGISRKHADVQALPEDERRFVVYWQPADIFCARLRGGLDREYRRRAIWINVWQDREAARYAKERSEVLPLVVLDGQEYTNPDPRTLIDELR